MDSRIDPWTSEQIKDYDAIFQQFGIKSFSEYTSKLKDPHLLMRRGIVIGHRNFDRIYDSISKKKDYAMMTGLMPSGKFHFGHKMVADQIIWHQEQGAEVFVAVADIEAYAVRGISLEEGRKTAIEEYITNYIALGLKPKKAHIYFQSDYKKEYYKLIGMLSKRATMNEFKAIYGDSISPAKMQAVLHQAADMMHAQLPEFGGKRPTVIPVGVDQDPHIRICRDMMSRASEFDMIPISSTYHKFASGLQGGKMSSSKVESYIALDEDSETVKNKINKYAFSGGQETIEKHRKLGGNPDVDVSYQWLTFLEEDDKKLEKIYNDYKSGALLTGELKAILIEKLNNFLKEHRKKREKAKKQIDKFMVKD